MDNNSTSTLPAPRLTKPELVELARKFFKTRDADAFERISSLHPSEKAYLATQDEFQEYILSLMFDSVIGIERATKAQRAAAAWFYRVIQEKVDGKKREKRGRVPLDAEVVDAGGDDE